MPIEISPKLSPRLKRIKLLLMDCDGVLTDGRLYFGATGEELKVFHARDGQGIVEWHAAGFQSGVISGRHSPIVEMRSRQLGIEFVFQGRNDKVAAFNEIVQASGVPPDEIAFIGDDTPDAAVFPDVGLAVAVGDAHEAAKAVAHFVTKSNGGRGAVREVIDVILASRR
jgi:3-deoxy-D-manno-octulosonate 8-phosphate phosphatase (KDO 8-P phosphatase)